MCVRVNDDDNNNDTKRGVVDIVLMIQFHIVSYVVMIRSKEIKMINVVRIDTVCDNVYVIVLGVNVVV